MWKGQMPALIIKPRSISVAGNQVDGDEKLHDVKEISWNLENINKKPAVRKIVAIRVATR